MMEYIYELIEKIKTKQLEILELEKQLAEKKRELAEIQKIKRDTELDIQKQVAFDKELKNDKQRQAKAKELLDTNEKYLSLLEAEALTEGKISDLIYQIKKENIELEYLKRLYEIELIKKQKEEAVS